MTMNANDFHNMPDDLKLGDTLYIVTSSGIVYKCIVTGWETKTYVGKAYWGGYTPSKQRDTKTYYCLTQNRQTICIAAGTTGYYIMRKKEDMKDLLKAMIMQ